ncbi:hypothetical protein [Methylophaga sp. OBS1]|jgi:hypothetical protein|uniref:hypothetical protein n=1 Tax=Methylophaga sp. OBS1 TaxID=2991933 RepID=UPI002255C86A|nr:hypothetical protein [Methylophaga sp. OBS1]MCX4192229.1 hypothetical protein [Methylophaga sp. OBS1]
MLNHIRLMFIALFMGLFLIACGDDSAQQDTAEEAAAPAEMTSEEAATETDAETQEAMPAEDSSSIEGMTEEEAIAKWGEPDVTQTRTIDALTITHHEWHGEDGTTAVQFQNGVAKFSQFVPAE